MILGVGIDLVEVSRIRASLQRFGDRFTARVLLPQEAAYCSACADPAIHVAARFAAKEAASKALGTGIGIELGWHDLEVVRGVTGRPELQWRGRGIDLARCRGVIRTHLSLTHTASSAAAVVVIESGEKN